MKHLYEMQFRSIRRLKDGWDGEGSRKFGEAPLRRAKFALDAIARRLSGDDVERLQVFPIVNDGFEAYLPGAYMFMMFDERNAVSVIGPDGKSSFCVDEAGVIDAIGAFLSAANLGR